MSILRLFERMSSFKKNNKRRRHIEVGDLGEREIMSTTYSQMVQEKIRHVKNRENEKVIVVKY